MPSHIAHMLFGRDVINKTNEKIFKSITEQHSNIFNLGCQGPDIFYHNRRTKPLGIKFGILLHHERYGRFVANYLRVLGKLICGPNISNIDVTDIHMSFSFILGFLTHALLDRKTHPFISYFSGWVDPTKPETKKYFMCHAFFERIIDTLLLEIKLNIRVKNFDFFSTIYCGETFPQLQKEIFFKALKHTFPEIVSQADAIKIENAYVDSMRYYDIANPIAPKLEIEIERYDIKKEMKLRRLALLHPNTVDRDIDFLNLKHRAWSHPCDDTDISTKSFLELYESAIKDANRILKHLSKVYKLINAPLKEYQETKTSHLEDGKSFSQCNRKSKQAKKFLHKLYKELNRIEKLIGSHDLDTPRPELTRCTPKYSDPLPLFEILDGMYRDLMNKIPQTL